MAYIGLKQLDQDPWDKIVEEFETGHRITCGISNITDYGLFVEIKEGIEGLVHVSEIDWTNNNPNPHKIAKIGDVAVSGRNFYDKIRIKISNIFVIDVVFIFSIFITLS